MTSIDWLILMGVVAGAILCFGMGYALAWVLEPRDYTSGSTASRPEDKAKTAELNRLTEDR